MSTSIRTPSNHQQGSVLLVAVVILLLASLMALMAMNVGVFEQRSSGNDLRAKLVNQVAEAGLAQGFELLMRANPAWVDDASKWTLCPDDDLANSGRMFPCGAVPASVRGSMWHLKADVGGYTDSKLTPLDTNLTKYMLKTDSNKAAGSFDVAYGVAPLVCRVSLLVIKTKISCSKLMSNISDRRVMTFVSVAQVRGESGRTTLTQTVARSSILAQGAEVASVIASGMIHPKGNGDVVAMPNAAGPGLDISLWTRLDVDMTSAFGTCDRQTFLASAGESLNTADWRKNSLDGGCPKKGGEGWDVLDSDTGTEIGVNKNVVASEFPCDLFEYAFGVKTWEDTDTVKDNFCETRLPKISVEINGKTVSLYPDEAFLYANASQIIGGDPALVTTEQTKADPSGSSSGLIWCKSGCSNGLPGKPSELGSPSKPVLLVVDGSMLNNGTIIYGMVFMRDPAATMAASTGGAAEFKQNGSNAAVFGSVFIQGEFTTGSGNGPIVGDADIMATLAKDPSLAEFNTLLGGWTDRYSY